MQKAFYTSQQLKKHSLKYWGNIDNEIFLDKNINRLFLSE